MKSGSAHHCDNAGIKDGGRVAGGFKRGGILNSTILGVALIERQSWMAIKPELHRRLVVICPQTILQAEEKK